MPETAQQITIPDAEQRKMLLHQIGSERARLLGFIQSKLSGSTPGGLMAEDVLQQTLLNATENIHAFRGEASLYTWLCSIALNLIKEAARSEQTRSELHQTKIDASQPPHHESAFSDPFLGERLQNAIQKLKPDQQKVLKLKLQGHSGQEIADALGLKLEAAKTRLHRAKRDLASMLAEEGVHVDELFQ